MSVRCDPKVPRKYGPLLRLGMTLREIRSHTTEEIMVMRAALNRYSVLENGYELERLSETDRAAAIRNNPSLISLRSDYREELYYYQLDLERRGIKEDKEE